MKITIGKFVIIEEVFGAYYEHTVFGDEKSGHIDIKDGEITDLSGDTDIPLSVLACLFSENIITTKSFCEQMSHRYIKD